MYEYLFHSYSIFIHYSKNMLSKLKPLFSSLSPMDDKRKPPISRRSCFTLFGRSDNLLLTGQQHPPTRIQPCPMVDGWLYTLGCN